MIIVPRISIKGSAIEHKQLWQRFRSSMIVDDHGSFWETARRVLAGNAYF